MNKCNEMKEEVPKKCCISNVMDGSEYDALWDELSTKEDSDVVDDDNNDDDE